MIDFIVVAVLVVIVAAAAFYVYKAKRAVKVHWMPGRLLLWFQER